MTDRSEPTRRVFDEPLRRRAVAALPSVATELARDALQRGGLEVEPDTVVWEGSDGINHGHRVTLWVDPTIAQRLEETPADVDLLTAAIAAAVGATRGSVLADLRIRSRVAGGRGSPYRGGA